MKDITLSKLQEQCWKRNIGDGYPEDGCGDCEYINICGREHGASPISWNIEKEKETNGQEINHDIIAETKKKTAQQIADWIERRYRSGAHFDTLLDIAQMIRYDWKVE